MGLSSLTPNPKFYIGLFLFEGLERKGKWLLFSGCISQFRSDLQKMPVKKKLKPLLPSLKEKTRYIGFEISSNSNFKGFQPINDAIMQECLLLMGELDLARAGPIVVKNKWKPSENKGIIKVNRKYVDHVKASLALIKQIKGKDVVVRSLRVSGMINKAG